MITMKKKKVFFVFMLNLMSLLVVAQSDIRLNNYWVNPQYINPASIYDKYQAVFSMAARKQWFGFPGAPTTYFASATTYLEKFHTQLGLIVLQDQIGYTSTSNIGLTYGYAIPFQRNWELHLGLGMNYQNLSYDQSKLNLATNSGVMKILLSPISPLSIDCTTLSKRTDLCGAGAPLERSTS